MRAVGQSSRQALRAPILQSVTREDTFGWDRSGVFIACTLATLIFPPAGVALALVMLWKRHRPEAVTLLGLAVLFTLMWLDALFWHEHWPKGAPYNPQLP